MSDYWTDWIELDLGGDVRVTVCDDCGALVGSRTIHDEWHERLERGAV